MRLDKQYLFIKSSILTYGRYLSNLGATFISQAVSALSLLFLTPILVHSLGADQFGVYGVLLNIVILSSVFDFGLNVGLLRKLIHEKEKSQGVINAMFFFFAFIFIISIPVFYLLFRSGLIKSDHRYFAIAAFTSLIVIQNIIAVFFDVIIQSVNKIFVGKLIRISKTIIEFIALFFVSKQGSVSLLLLTTVIVNFLYIAALFLFSKREVDYRISWHYFRFNVLREHIQYSFWYFQNTLATVLVYNAQVILISTFVDSGNITKYLLVTRFYDVIRTGLANFTMVLFPSLSKLQAEQNWRRIRKMFLQVLLRVTIMVCIVFSLIPVVGKGIFIYWSKYHDSVTVYLFQIYSLYIALLIIDHVPTVFLSALKFNKMPSIVATVQGVFGLCLSVVWLPVYGITGAVYASLIALCCTNLFFNPIYLFTRINKQ